MKRRLSDLVSVSGDPHELALAFALGILLGVLPGTGAFVAAGVAAALGMNVPLAVGGALVINPVTAPFIYGASFFIGRSIFDEEVARHVVTDVLVKTITGNVILAFGMAVLGYIGVLFFIHWVRARKKRHAARH